MTVLLALAFFFLLSAAATTIASVLYIRSTAGADIDPKTVLYRVSMWHWRMEDVPAQPAPQPMRSRSGAVSTQAAVQMLESGESSILGQGWFPVQGKPGGTVEEVLEWVAGSRPDLTGSLNLDGIWFAEPTPRHAGCLVTSGRINESAEPKLFVEVKGRMGSSMPHPKSRYSAADYTEWLRSSMKSDPRTVN
jgi:hypothetical protein